MLSYLPAIDVGFESVMVRAESNAHDDDMPSIRRHHHPPTLATGLMPRLGTLWVEDQHSPRQPGHRLLACPRQHPILQCPPQLARQQVTGLSDCPRLE